ncbi:AsnC family transcriptional regulator [archaeon CG10_big_fil_rev_8_21_14_0_10_43_11]|nr:MAG: AsnC family transcriptional regulator [archaeon CG10_big_fil_rev_8_21_14_0_10_43_11]
MVKAYILATVKPGTESFVAEKLNRLKEVEDIDIVYGDYDIIFKVKTKTLEDLRSFTVETLRRIKHIQNTTTMITT